MEYNKQAHAVWKCEYHIVLVTKYRRGWINEGIFAYMELKLREIRRYQPEIRYLEVNHGRDHIHLLVSIPPKMSVGSVVRRIKSNTAREVKQKFPVLKSIYWGTGSVWSSGYFVSTVGINERVIRNYIQNQGREDSAQAKLELG